MNNKRQTIWLVSMLSLMVVLSAYYLFTDDVKNFNPGLETKVSKEVKIDSQTMAASGKQANDANKKAEDAAGNQTKIQSKQQSDQQANNQKKQGESDAEILKKMSAQVKSGSDYFTNLQMKRTEDLSRQTERLYKIITDSKQNNEAVNKAYEDLRKIEDKEAKVTNLEELLMKDYSNALVMDEGEKWKVVVQAKNMEKSEAVSIVDLVMKDMNVGPDRVSVQYVQ